MARDYADYTDRGARIAAIVVDTPAQNAAMADKLALPFPVLSDPDGSQAIKPFDTWNGSGNMAKPAIIVVDPDGVERYRYVGEDFADRPGDDDVLAAIAALELSPVESVTEPVAHVDPEPSPRAIGLADLSVYMRGVRFAMVALAGRARDPYDKSEAERTSKLAESYIAAQGATMRLRNRSL